MIQIFNDVFQWLEEREHILKTELETIQSVRSYLASKRDEKEVEEIFNEYMRNIEAYCDWKKLENGNDPDENFMRAIESTIGISEITKKAFREEMLIRKSAASRKGKQFTCESNDRLKLAIDRYFLSL